MLRRLKPLAIAVATWILPGFLLWTAFPPKGETANALFALAPLLFWARRGTVRQAARAWFLGGLVFWGATLMWMPAIMKNGGPAALVALGWFALAAYCALYFGAFGGLAAAAWGWAREGGYGRRLAVLLAAEPLLWAGLELVRARLFGGFAWNLLGVPSVCTGFGAPAAMGGVCLVSALVVLVNGTVASIAERMWAGMRRPGGGGREAWATVPRWVRSCETFLPLGLVWLCFSLAPQPPPESDTRHLTVALVQRNYPCVFDRDRAERENPAEVYGKLFGNVSILRPDLVVLAESALAEFGSLESRGVRRFVEFAFEETGAKALLAGGGRSESGREYNSAALYTQATTSQTPQTPRPPNSSTLQPFNFSTLIYDKVHLVPFGEYIPFDKTFPCLQRFAPVGSCTAGELKLLELDGVQLGVAICFEDTDAAQVRRLAAMGAQLLVFITNDSWFSQSDEAVQHAWQCVARAIETGLPVVRVGNSGVTGSVAPDGSATWLLDAAGKPLVDRTGTMVERVRLGGGGPPTPYVRWGDAPLLTAFALLLAALAFRRLRHLYWRWQSARTDDDADLALFTDAQDQF